MTIIVMIYLVLLVISAVQLCRKSEKIALAHSVIFGSFIGVILYFQPLSIMQIVALAIIHAVLSEIVKKGTKNL